MIVVVLILIVLIYFLKKSKSVYFQQEKHILLSNRDNVVALLSLKNRSISDIEKYIIAYDFFCVHTDKFDGATIVKDLHDIDKLDLDAMVHDYESLIGANRNLIKWFKSAWYYFENMRKNGKGNQIIRFVLLLIAGLIFVPYCLIFRKPYKL